MKFLNLISKKKIAASPGSVIHVGEQRSKTVEITVIQYGTVEYSEKVVDDPAEIRIPKKKGAFTWIEVSGLHDTDRIKKLGDQFGIDALVLEDIVNTTHRPKLEEFENYTVQILKALEYSTEAKRLLQEQVSFILGHRYLITFSEQRNALFEPVKNRIRKGRKNINARGTDYLMYALSDALVDQYYVSLEKIAEEIENTEEEILNRPEPQSLLAIQKLKKEIISLRKSIWPLREILNAILRSENRMFQEYNMAFYRDVYDHTIQIIETGESFRDLASGLQDLYMATVSNHMNQVMKVLTIIATIFIPLTFLAGIYGMNFEFMPELKWRAGYFIIWGIMFVTAVIMAIWFKRKKWW